MSLTEAFLLDPYPFNVWIAHCGDGAGSGTANDPWDGSTQARFDAILSSLETLYPHGQVHVHLGPSPRDENGNPSPFETNGYRAADGVGWQVRPGMKLIGFGREITVLKLVNATSDSPHLVIGHNRTRTEYDPPEPPVANSSIVDGDTFFAHDGSPGRGWWSEGKTPSPSSTKGVVFMTLGPTGNPRLQ